MATTETLKVFWVVSGGGSLPSAQDFLQYSSSSSRLERDHDRGSDGHAAEDRKERLRRTVAEADEEEEEEDEKEVAKDEEEEEEEVEESKYRKPSLQPPALTLVEGSQGHQRSEGENSSFETKVTISTFGSIMRITSSSGLSSGGKIRKISSGDYKPSKSLCKPSHLTTPPILEEADLEEDKATPPPPPPLPPPPPPPGERRHRGNKKSRHGPGRPRGGKNRENGRASCRGRV